MGVVITESHPLRHCKVDFFSCTYLTIYAVHVLQLIHLILVPKPVLEISTRTDKAKRVDTEDDIREELSMIWSYSHLQWKLSMDFFIYQYNYKCIFFTSFELFL